MTWNPPAQQSAWSSPMSSCISQPLQRSSSSGAWLCQMGMMQTQQLWWPPILVWNWLGSFAVENRDANHQLSGERPFEIYIRDHHGILQLCVTGMYSVLVAKNLFHEHWFTLRVSFVSLRI
jgi:hypothetical protein